MCLQQKRVGGVPAIFPDRILYMENTNTQAVELLYMRVSLWKRRRVNRRRGKDKIKVYQIGYWAMYILVRNADTLARTPSSYKKKGQTNMGESAIYDVSCTSPLCAAVVVSRVVSKRTLHFYEVAVLPSDYYAPQNDE